MAAISREELIAEILQLGLFFDDRGNIYGSQYESALKSTGLWQHPEEFADLLLFLADKRIKSFLNVGTFNGATFNFIADFLSRDGLIKCVTVDPFDFNPVRKTSYCYLTTTSTDFARVPFDLVFIDGDHEYSAVKQDWENVGKYARFAVFHDIDDDFIRELDGGVCRFWEELKVNATATKHTAVEFIHKCEKGYPRTMGIGVMCAGK